MELFYAHLQQFDGRVHVLLGILAGLAVYYVIIGLAFWYKIL